MSVHNLPGHVFIMPGDLTQLRADVLVYSTSTGLSGSGHLYAGFSAAFPWFAAAYTQAEAAIRSANIGCAIGQTLCLEPPHGQGPTIIVVASTIDRSVGTTTQEHLSRAECTIRAIQGALTTAHDCWKQRPTPGRFLVALPTLRIGLGGDRNDRLRSARTQVWAAHECLRAMPGVDVAFVPFTPDNHQVFLQARRDVLGGPPSCPLPEGSKSERLLRLIEEIRAGRCVLFVGAGLSWQLPGWTALLNALAADLGRPPLTTFDLRTALDLADDYLWERGGSQLATQIRSRYADYNKNLVRPTPAHYLLLTLPLRLVITTNYDDLLERTLTALRRHHRLVLRDQEVIHTGTANPLCVVKLHGDPKADGGRGMVLARGQYEAFRVQHPGLALLLAGSLLNQTFLFVGYSRVDPNFQEIFAEVAELYEGAGWQAFATSVDPPTSGTTVGSQLQVVEMPADDMAMRIHQLALFLDWLADAVLLGAGQALAHDRPVAAADLPLGLFLAPDVLVAGAGPAHALRQNLLNQIAVVVEQACGSSPRTELRPEEARHLIRMLRFLVEQGWRPSESSGQTAGMRLSSFWERLAEAVANTNERNHCLAAAWRFAERNDDVRRLGGLLGHTDH